MDWKASLLPALRACLMGALASAALPSVLSLYFGVRMMMEADMTGGLFAVALPFLIAFGATLAAMIVWGIPATLLLRHWNMETRGNYQVAGIAGAAVVGLVTIIFSSIAIGLVMGFFAMISGVVTATTWWTHGRQRQAEQGYEDVASVFS